MRRVFFLCVCICCSLNIFADFYLVRNGNVASLYYPGEETVVKTALEMLVSDSKLVCNDSFRFVEHADLSCVFVGTIGADTEFDTFLSRNKVDFSDIKGKWEAFKIKTVKVGKENYLLSRR